MSDESLLYGNRADNGDQSTASCSAEPCDRPVDFLIADVQGEVSDRVFTLRVVRHLPCSTAYPFSAASSGRCLIRLEVGNRGVVLMSYGDSRN